MKIPAELARAIEQRVAQYEPRALSQAAIEISARYRGELPLCRATTLSTDLHCAAYLVTRLPATLSAVAAALDHVKSRMPAFSPRSVLDLGAGPGTGAWAALEMFPGIRSITLLERDAQTLTMGQKLAAASSSAALHGAQWIHADLTAADFASGTKFSDKFDLILISYAFGELPQHHRTALLKRIWGFCSHTLLIVEPGTPHGYQNILQARSELLLQGAHMVAPCPHDNSCPLQEMPGEWCHFAQRLERTALHRRMKQGGLGYEDEKFSYVSVGRDVAQPSCARIIRHPLHAKGHIQLQLCAQQGVEKVTVTKSQKDLFRAARRAKWGGEWPCAIDI